MTAVNIAECFPTFRFHMLECPTVLCLSSVKKTKGARSNDTVKHYVGELQKEIFCPSRFTITSPVRALQALSHVCDARSHCDTS